MTKRRSPSSEPTETRLPTVPGGANGGLGCVAAVACSSRKTSVAFTPSRTIRRFAGVSHGRTRRPVGPTSTIAPSVPSSACDRSWSKFIERHDSVSPRTARLRSFPLFLLFMSFANRGTAQTSPTPSDAMLAHARKLLRSTPLIDGHNDLPWAIRESKTAPRDVKAYDLRAQTHGTD